MAEAGTLFGYLAAFVTIMLALAVGDLAQSLHRLIRARRTIRWHPLPLVAAFWVLLALLTSFFGLWLLTEISTVGYDLLFWLVVPQLFYFLAACAVLPDEAPPGLDLLKFYMEERRYLFTVLALGFAAEFADDMIREGETLMTAPTIMLVRYFGLTVLIFGAFAVMWKNDKRWVHWAGFVVLFVTAILGFVGWEIHGEPAVPPGTSFDVLLDPSRD